MADSNETPLRRLLTNLVAPATVTTAVLYYFGWLRSQTIAGQFGYDASLLGLSTQDYILRSVQPVGTLAVVAGLLAWPVVVWHRWLAERRNTGRLGRLGAPLVVDSLLALGLVAMAIALVWTWVGFSTAGYLLPVLCALAAVAIGYGSWLRGTARTRLAPEVVWAISVLALAGVFILTSVYARQSGLDQARRNIERARTSAVVTVTTSQSLGLPGLPEHRAGDTHTVTGLSLMFTAGGYHFLLPRDFDQKSRARVHTVPVSNSRLDFDASWAIPCVGFDDLTGGDVFAVGDSFTSAGVRYLVGPGPAGPEDGQHQTGVAVESDDPSGNRLRLVGATISPQFSARYDAWLLDYRQLHPTVVVGAGVETHRDDSLVALARAEVLQPEADLVVDGGSNGRLRIRGGERPLTGLAIGGAELIVDCPVDS